MKYLLADAPRLVRPHALLDKDRTKITEHPHENPGMSAHHVAQELRTRPQTRNDEYNTKKRRAFSLLNFLVARTEAKRSHSTLQLLQPVFQKI